MEVEELHVEVLSAGFVRDSLCKMRFTCSGWTEKEDIFAFFDKVACCELTYESRVDRRIE